MGSQIFIMHGSKSISRDKRYYCLLSVAWGNLLLKFGLTEPFSGKKRDQMLNCKTGLQ